MAQVNKYTGVKRILSGAEKTPFLLIKQRHDCRALPLLKCIISKWKSNPSFRLFVLLLDKKPSTFGEGNLDGVEVISLREYFGNKSNSFIEMISSFVSTLDPSKANRVIIDNLDSLLIMYSPKEVTMLVQSLLQSTDSLVSCVSLNRIDSELKRLWTCFLTISRPQADGRVVFNGIIKRKHPRLISKIDNLSEIIHIKKDYSFEVLANDVTSKGPNAEEKGNDTDLKTVTTFNLSLSDEQKAAKNQVQLPYIRFVFNELIKYLQYNIFHFYFCRKQTTSNKDIATTSNAGGGGNVYYIPDKFDDVDEEDPDDDLDI